MSKVKTAVAVKNGSNGVFNSVFLTWVLSLLVIPVVLTLIPAFFDKDNANFNYQGETLWYFIWSDIWKNLLIFTIISLLIAFAASLILNKNYFGKITFKKLINSVLVIASILNIAFIAGVLIFNYLLPAFGLTV